MCFERNGPNWIKLDLFKVLLESVPVAHTFTDLNEARVAMGELLHYHSSRVAELCSCYVCTTIADMHDRQWHDWRFCSNQFKCWICYNLISETVHVLMPKRWPMWAKRGHILPTSCNSYIM